MAEIKINESQSQEIGNYYSRFSKKYNIDLDELVYGKDGFMNNCYPNGFPDFAGDVIYSEKYWNEFEKWLKDTKGIELTEGKDNSCCEEKEAIKKFKDKDALEKWLYKNYESAFYDKDENRIETGSHEEWESIAKDLEIDGAHMFGSWADGYVIDLNDYMNESLNEEAKEEYNVKHAEEWMEKHPHGWYNNENDYGSGDEEDEEEYNDEAKIRLIWDECTPTRDRRPTTAGDIYDDIHIKEFSNKEELLDKLKVLCDIWDEEDLDELNTIEEKIEQCISYLDDPGDGSPNILYLNIDGEEKDYDGIFPYDCLEDLDLNKCSEEDVKKAIIDYEKAEGYLDESLNEGLGDDFYGYKEGTEEADDVLFALQVQYGRPEYDYDDFRKLNLAKEEVEKAINYVKEKGYDKFTYFDESLNEEKEDYLSTEEFLSWHDGKGGLEASWELLQNIYDIFTKNGFSEDDYVDVAYEGCPEADKVTITKLIKDDIANKHLNENFSITDALKMLNE